MSLVSVQLNSFSLQSSTVVSSTIAHDAGPPIQLSALKATRQDGEKLISSIYAPKTITIAGRIKGTSQSDLETNLDTFKKSVAVVEGNLDIEYAGGYRRYVVALQSTAIERAHYHLTFVPFSITFRVYDPPFGKQVASLGGSLTENEFFTSSAISALAVEETFTFDGTAKPKPTFRFTVDRPGSLRTIRMRNRTTFQEISISNEFLSGDVVTIDTEDQEVLLNGLQDDYEGMFPEFELGTNKVELHLIDQYGLNQEQAEFNSVAVIKGNHIEEAQIFKPSTTAAYSRMEVLVRKNKEKPATGRLIARLWTTSGSLPSVITEQIYIDNEKIGETFSWIDLPFTSVSLTAATSYAISLLPENEDEIFEVAYNDESLYTDGNRARKFRRTGSWTAKSTNDLAFRVYRNLNGIWSIDGLGKYTKRYL